MLAALAFLHVILHTMAEGFTHGGVMDISSIASSLASGNAAGQVNASLVHSVNNLEGRQVQILLSSLGIGQNVNTLA